MADNAAGPASANPPSESPARPREESLKVTVKRRLEQEGRWAEVEPVRDQMFKDTKLKDFESKEARQEWIYGELDQIYPPLSPANGGSETSETDAHPPMAGQGGQILGLSNIPEDWPELPANASMGAEIAWAQANRLRVVDEGLGRATQIHLERALTPAPSWAALGWLETSVRSYAKFVDVAAKVASSYSGEADLWKHERVAIDEMEEMSEGYERVQRDD